MRRRQKAGKCFLSGSAGQEDAPSPVDSNNFLENVFKKIDNLIYSFYDRVNDYSRGYLDFSAFMVTVQTGSKSCEKVCCKLAFLACISAFSQDLVSG